MWSVDEDVVCPCCGKVVYHANPSVEDFREMREFLDNQIRVAIDAS